MEASSKSIFFGEYNVTNRDLETYLAEALSRGGDYADLYFEYRINHSVALEEQIVKSATKAISRGVGVRVISGEKTGYAYSDSLEREHILKMLQETNWVVGGPLGAAARLGMKRTTLQSRMKNLGIARPK